MEAARRATAADVPRLGELARGAIAELVTTKGGEIWARREARPEPLEASLAAAVDDPDQLVVVGTIDGAALGYGVVRVERLRDGADLGVVDDIYVEPEARGVGLGQAIMDMLVAWCAARGCIGVDGLALPGNRATKNFFERFGLVARGIIVHKRLEP